MRPKSPMRSLSGGNQQKVLFARAIDARTGPDCSDRSDRRCRRRRARELHDLLRAAAAEGTSALLGSSDFEEVAAICNRVSSRARRRDRHMS